MDPLRMPEECLTKNWPETKISYIVRLGGYGYDKTKLIMDTEEERWFWAFFAVGKEQLKGVLGTTRCRGSDGWVYTLRRVGMRTYLARLEKEE